jgi:PadR family transcriptional regulator, regulatory protein AphA
MARAVSIRHLILGLLAQESMSGYDIKRLLKSLSWLMDSPSFGSIYPVLRSLREEGLVTMEEVLSQGKSPRKVYTTTQSGRQTLREWVDQSITSGTSLKAFVTRLILADSFSHTELITHLQQRRSEVLACHTALKQLAEAEYGTLDSGQRLTFDYGLALATAELAWLDGALAQLSQQPLPRRDSGSYGTPSMEVVKGDRIAQTA